MLSSADALLCEHNRSCEPGIGVRAPAGDGSPAGERERERGDSSTEVRAPLPGEVKEQAAELLRTDVFEERLQRFEASIKGNGR